MKADWSKAPEWATARAVDDDGMACWFSDEPEFESGTWQYGGDCELDCFVDVGADFDPSTTLEMRPA